MRLTEGFKLISASFLVDIKAEGGKTLKVSVERVPSGCFRYGDCSSHVIKVDGRTYKVFDTRYDCIPTGKRDWCNYWLMWIANNWFGQCTGTKMAKYEEREIE